MAEELTEREKLQRNMADVLDYLMDNYNIGDKAVREGKLTNMDIAKSFTGDVKRKEILDQIGLLDFTPIGAYFALDEGQDKLMKAEPDNFKRQLALLSYVNNPIMTTIARPDIGLPLTAMNLSVLEAIPMTAYMTKPLRRFLSSLKSKSEMQNPSQIND